MKSYWRQVEIELTPQQEPVWDETVSDFIRTSNSLRDYHDPPITCAIKGKANLPFDIDMILELITFLKKPSAHPGISDAICSQLSSLMSREKMF